MSSYLEILLKGVDPGTITEIFFWLIMGSLIVAILLRKIGKAHAYVNYSATLLTSLGILGTFIGIVVGLLDFDAADIDGSIGLLLAGLKTAFITSLVGMSASIIYKVLGSFPWANNTVAAEIQDVGADDVYRAINEQGSLMLKSSLKQQELLADLKRAIVGSEDDTLVSQVKLLRADMNDNHKTTKAMDERLAVIQATSSEQQQTFQQFSDKLWERLQVVADTIAKSATEEVIKALKDVITDFNNNLIEQFGDNFKALDESVKKLVTWQENYSQQIEQMVDQYALGVTAINQTKDSVSIISEKSEHIPETMSKLKGVMEVNQEQIETLGGHLEAFKDMRDKAVEAVPEINKQVEETVNKVTQSANTASEHYTSLLTDSDAYIKNHADTSKQLLEQFVANTKEGIDAVKTGLESGAANVSEGLNNSSKDFMEAIKTGAKEFTSSVHETNDSLLNTSYEIEKQTEVIRDHLQDTVTELNANVRDMAAKVADESKNLSSTLIDANKQTLSDISQVQKEVVDSNERMQQRFEKVLEEIFQKQASEVTKTFNALETELTNAVGSTSNAVDEQIKLIQEASTNDINAVMNEMAKALTSITGKFTKDYTKLVHAMKAITHSQEEYS